MTNNFDLEDWAETHYEITVAIERISDRNFSIPDKDKKGQVHEMEYEFGMGGKWMLSYRLTNEFHEKYSEVNWEKNLIGLIH